MYEQGAWFLWSMSGKTVVYPSSSGTCTLKVEKGLNNINLSIS
ncbi:hypothetical protein SLEP1_g27137 [Rubroshorea leprosula]|uniref:Uncharacterized protein n=1 Tax=Rubroshorea leprosula TaxID=152421 RepID=A0AAV5JPL2_9ROSI|nr:hypothetical protein SLEP1_g27137 [Rubroshorea leprosula]